jgi:pimeloyl-ACP methyl ester carboxylesterase
MLLTFRNERLKAAVVFIHGFGGHAANSWAQFQRFLITDPRAKEWDCFSFGYQSLRRQLHVVAHDFYLSLKSPPLVHYERIAIVAHSTGGLVAQIALLDHDDLAKRIAYVFFFALPSRGMLPPAKMLSALPILGQLFRAFSETWMAELQPGNPLLSDLSNRWDKKFGQGAPFVYYSVAAARDRIVLIGALTSLGAEHRLILDEDHFSVIKPTAARRESLEIVISGLNDQSVPQAARRRADVVVELAAKEKDDTYDVFMYYGRADSDAGRDIAQRLLGIGKKPWLIEEQGVGQNWWPKLMSDIDRINSVAIFFGAPFGAGWRKQQLSGVIAEFAKRQKPILPVFLPNAPPDDSDLPELLQTVVPVNWSDAQPEAFGHLVAGIEGKRIAMRKQMTSTASHVPASRIPRRRRFIWAVLGLSAVLITVLIMLANRGIISIDRSPFDITAAYIGSAPYNKPVAVVFVHGIIGARDATWKNQAASFPALLESDPEFHNKIDTFVYEYFTPKFGNANSIVGLADQFRGSLDDHRVFDNHQRVVFVSHSMGGLVVRLFLLNKRERLAKVPMLYFYATPTNGSELTIAAREISKNPQLRGMLPLEGNDLLQSIQSLWLGWDAAKKLPSYCAYETLPTFGVMVVSMGSATALCNEDLDPITANHIDIVKPKDRDDPRYTRLAHALRSVLTSQSVLPAAVALHDISGEIYDENGPLVGASVSAAGVATTTDNTGGFQVVLPSEKVPPDGQKVPFQVKMKGYASIDWLVSVPHQFSTPIHLNKALSNHSRRKE